MGHTRLGKIPKSARWSSIIGIIAGEGGDEGDLPLCEAVAQIALDALEAAETGLEKASNDIGLCYTFFLLIKTILAARADRWTDELERLGIHLSEQHGLLDLTSEIQARIDDHLYSHSCNTDIAEMAQQAASEAYLSSLLALRILLVAFFDLFHSGWTFFILLMDLNWALASGKNTSLTTTVSIRMAMPKLPMNL